MHSASDVYDAGARSSDGDGGCTPSRCNSASSQSTSRVGRRQITHSRQLHTFTKLFHWGDTRVFDCHITLSPSAPIKGEAGHGSRLSQAAVGAAQSATACRFSALSRRSVYTFPSGKIFTGMSPGREALEFRFSLPRGTRWNSARPGVPESGATVDKAADSIIRARLGLLRVAVNGVACAQHCWRASVY